VKELHYTTFGEDCPDGLVAVNCRQLNRLWN